MTAMTTLARWTEVNWESNTADPLAYVLLALREGELAGDFDVDALTAAWIEAVNDDIAEEFSDQVTLHASGEVLGPAHLDPQEARAAVRRAITDVDFATLAAEHDRTAGPYRIKCYHVLGNRPGEKARIYNFEAGLHITEAQAVTEAKRRFIEETGYIPQEVALDVLDHDDAGEDQPQTPRSFHGIERSHEPMTMILSMDALTLPHRLAINPNGAEFHIDGLEFEARSGQVIIQLTPYDEYGKLLPDAQVGVYTLRGWKIQ